MFEKELQKTNQEESKIEKVVKEKGDKLYVKWKGYDNSFNNWIEKQKILYKMSQYFPKPYEPLERDRNFKVDLSHYATKTDFKKSIGIDTSNLGFKMKLS